MSTVELRRYEIASGMMETFLDVWPGLARVREANGFRVLFAFADDENNQFVWAIEHDGDFAAGERAYLESPDRIALASRIPDAISGSLNAKVRAVAF